jgi:hypothetical protein
MAKENDDGKNKLEPIFANQLDEIVKSKDAAMRAKLREIEADYKHYLQACLDTCRSMENLAAEDHRLLDLASYRLKAQIYRQLLDNYTLSRSYNRE